MIDTSSPSTTADLQSRQQNVASGRQAGAGGAQEPECTCVYMRIPSTDRARLTVAQ